MDYETIMQANLERVFGERDASRRMVAIRKLYVEDAELHEPQQSVRGHDAISHALTDLLAHLPLDFTLGNEDALRPMRPIPHQPLARNVPWTSLPTLHS
ncbi:MAG: hypothetical protein WEB56_12115 [Roseovarius sp.]